MNINSAFRTSEHDKSPEVGGSGSGRHVDGYATDFRIEGATAQELTAFAEQLGFRQNSRNSTGFTYEINNRSIHIDTDGHR